MFVTQWMLVLHFQWYSKAFDLTVCHSISMLVLKCVQAKAIELGGDVNENDR